MRAPRCSACGLFRNRQGLMSTDDGDVCPPCFFHRSIRRDRLTMGGLIDACEDRGICVYCGETAESLDHVVPQSTGMPTYTVPACQDCNSMCGARIFACLEDKRAWVADRLRKRYRKVLSIPEWDDEELDDLGYSLRKYVDGASLAKGVVVSRIAFADIAQGAG